MQITRHTDYGFRVLIYCALRPGAPATTHDIATRYGISNNHLVKVVQRLSRLGYLEAQRGKGGGIRLARPAAEINLGRVVADMEGLALVECHETGNACRITPSCRLKGILGGALAAFIAELARHTLADVVSAKPGTPGELAHDLGLDFPPPPIPRDEEPS